MESKASSKNTILNYGLVYGLILILMSVTLYALNLHYEKVGGYIGLGVLVITILLVPILGMAKFKRDNLNIMSWGQAVKIGMGIIILGTLINIIYSFGFSEFIEPTYNETVLELQKNELLATEQFTPEQIDQQIEISAMFQGTLLGAGVGILFFAFVGFVISAIAGAIMKRSDPNSY
jgi:hypothetical protein